MSRPAKAQEVADDQRWLTPGVRGIGGASLLADLGHEVPTSLLPGLLAGVQSFGNVVASATAGVLWTAVSPAAGLLFAALLMAVALSCLAWGAGSQVR